MMIGMGLILACTPAAPEGMLWVPGGMQYLGSPHPDEGLEGGQRPPELSWVSGFYLDQHEVTQAEYGEFVAATGYRAPFVDEAWGQEWGLNWSVEGPPAPLLDHPVMVVNWYDAREYCRWRGRRLPSEAEWERAAYGSDGRLFPWGRSWEEGRCNYGRLDFVDACDDSDGWRASSPVGTFPEGAGPWGHLDLFGNAWEWTADVPAYDWESVRELPIPGIHINPRGPEHGLYHAVRGGSYYFPLKDAPWNERLSFLTELRRKTAGFRCAWSG